MTSRGRCQKQIVYQFHRLIDPQIHNRSSCSCLILIFLYTQLAVNLFDISDICSHSHWQLPEWMFYCHNQTPRPEQTSLKKYHCELTMIQTQHTHVCCCQKEAEKLHSWENIRLILVTEADSVTGSRSWVERVWLDGTESRPLSLSLSLLDFVLTLMETVPSSVNSNRLWIKFCFNS